MEIEKIRGEGVLDSKRRGGFVERGESSILHTSSF